MVLELGRFLVEVEQSAPSSDCVMRSWPVCDDSLKGKCCANSPTRTMVSATCRAQKPTGKAEAGHARSVGRPTPGLDFVDVDSRLPKSWFPRSDPNLERRRHTSPKAQPKTVSLFDRSVKGMEGKATWAPQGSRSIIRQCG